VVGEVFIFWNKHSKLRLQGRRPHCHGRVPAGERAPDIHLAIHG